MTTQNPMRTIATHLARALVLALLFVAATPAFAQDGGDDQAYKVAYNEALEAAKANNLDEAYTKFGEAAELAGQAGEDAIAQRASQVRAQIDYNRGALAAKNENYDQALTYFNQGIENDPQYAKNYLGKASALRKQENINEAMAAYQQAIEVGEQSDPQIAQAAQNSIRGYYTHLASQALSRGGENVRSADAEEALGYLDEMEQYVEADADTYFYRATAANALGNYEQAIQYADQAISMHNGSRSDAAKLYFAKGEALMYMGNIAEAKAAFQNATYGSYKASAEHYLETL